MIRAFLAVELSEGLRARVSQVQRDLKQRLDREASPRVRISWVRPESIHLTIKFLGDIDESLVEPLGRAIESVVKAHQPIHIPIERLGAFPHLVQPKIVWIGAPEQWERGEEAQRLAALHQAIETCCDTLGFAPDARPLSPHLTLARIKEGGGYVGKALVESGVMARPLSLGSLDVGPVVLMQSDLRPTGSVYTKLWEVPLSSV